MRRSENTPEMTTDKTLGEQLGRRLGERIGRVLGQKAGRTVGEWLGRTLDRENQPDGSAGTGSESDDTVASSPHPGTRDELEEMSYRELQSLAKNAGVKANITKEEMIERLADTLNIGSEEQ
jgi:hypothetical protein